MKYQWYFHAMLDPHGDGNIIIEISEKEYFDKEGCVNDNPISDEESEQLGKLTEAAKIGSLTESVYEPFSDDVTLDDLHKTLLGLGFIEDKAFSNFITRNS